LSSRIYEAISWIPKRILIRINNLLSLFMLIEEPLTEIAQKPTKMIDRVLIIGTRGSDLAVWQANYVKNKLADIGVQAELKIIKTQGDIVEHLRLDKMEGKGLFTKEM